MDIIYKENISLHDLAQEPYPVLLDTSVLINSLEDNKPKALWEKIAESKENYSFFLLMEENYIKKESNFYITSLVLRELQASNYPFKKKIKRKGSYGDKELLELLRKRKKECKEQRRLANAFQENERILQLDENQKFLYQIFYERYIGLKGEHGLSETDLDFLFSGLTLPGLGNYVALASNDFGIIHAMEDILRREYFRPEKVNFFIREGFSHFRKKIFS